MLRGVFRSHSAVRVFGKQHSQFRPPSVFPVGVRTESAAVTTRSRKHKQASKKEAADASATPSSGGLSLVSDMTHTALARRWRETATAARQRPAITRALDLIQKQRTQPPSDAKAGADADALGAERTDVAALIAELMEHPASDDAGPTVEQAQGRVKSSLQAFRGSLSETQVRDALTSAQETSNELSPKAEGNGHSSTPHEKHRRHLLRHVDIKFALRALRIHVQTMDDGTEWIDCYLGPNAAKALKREDDETPPTANEMADVYHAAIVVLLQEHHVHDTLIEDAMEKVLMPQVILLEECCCLILRCIDTDVSTKVDGVQELTHRLTVFLFEGKVITLHRHDLPGVRSIRRRFDERFKASTRAHLLNALVYGCLQSFRKELARATVDFDRLESKLFEPQELRSDLARDMYVVKRRASVCARVVTMMAEAYAHAAGFLSVAPRDGYYQDVIHEFSQVKTTCEELNDNAHNVMQLLFQLSSYQLNELMRVLTMFSAFFIPLTFIAGVYGMNFEHMPLVHDDRGFVYCLAAMATVGASVLCWFRLRGF